MIVSSRAEQVAADRETQKAITDLMRQIAERVAGALLEWTSEDGTVPLSSSRALRDRVRASIEPLFVSRVRLTGDELDAERAHVDRLIAQARQDLAGAKGQMRTRLLARLKMLATRGETLGAGWALLAFRNGEPQSPYARIVLGGTEQVTRAVVLRHAGVIETLLKQDPELVDWLRGARRDGDLFGRMMRGQPVLTWPDTRGYALSDRIWQVGESTLARIDALLDEGIAQGRAAVSIAEDLERFLLAERRGVVTWKPYPAPYGTAGSFDARRLARSEITRAASMAGYTSGLANPFVTRARYHLSGSHNPKNCDGTCDQHYAEDQANGGFPADEVPLPMLDTHPQCLCYITHEVADQAAVVARLRETMRQDLAETAGQGAPPTPILVDLLVGALIGRLMAGALPVKNEME